MPGDPQAYAELLSLIGDCLFGGGVALLPAEGLYGLHACAAEEAGVAGEEPPGLARLRHIKGDPPGRPYIILTGTPEGAGPLLADLPKGAAVLIEKAWPGPLTLILPAAERVPRYLVRDGWVAVRCPGSGLLRDLARALPGPLLSTSANRAGRSAPAALGDLEPEVRESCDLIVEGGRLAGRGSTIARFDAGGELTILRPGLWVP
jgi:L-threonylcarbamoyladenylate synthase